MADLSYTVDVNTTPAQRNLDNLNKKLAGVRNAFSSLGAAIAGLAIGSAIRSVIQYADAIQDLSDATDIAVVDLVNFQKAVELSGGTAEVAQVSVQKLALSINEAASGSAKTQAAFRDVGVSIENLRRLSERDILIKTVQGLAQIDDASKRAALATDLLGKSARGLNFKNVADELGTTSIAAQKAADSYRKLADFQDKLDRSGQKLRESIANVLSPLLDKINQLPQDKLNAMIDAFVKLAAAITALVVVLPIIERIGKGIIYLGGAMATAYAAFKLGSTQFVGGFASIAKTAGIAKDYIDRFIRGTPQFDRANGPIKNMATLFEKLAQRIPYAGKGLGIMIAGLGRMIPLIGGVITALALLDQALKLLTGNDLGAWFDKSAAGLEEWVTNKFPKLAAALNSLGEKLGMAPPPSAMAEAQKAHDNEMKRILERSKALQESLDGGDRNREVVDATAKLYQEHAQRISEIRLEYQQLVSASRQHSDQLQSDLRFQIAKLKMSEDEIEMAEALRNETQRYLDLRDDLDKKFSKTSLDLANEQQKRKTANDEEKTAIDLRIQQLQEELDQIRKLGDQYYQNHIANGKAIEQELGQLQRLRFEEKQRIADMERMGQLIEAQIQRQQVLGDVLQSANDKLKDVQFQGDQQKRNPLEQQFANIQEEARKAALEAGRAFAASFEGMDLTSEQAQELANGLEQIAQKYQLIAQEQNKQLEYSRSWEAGWKDAFDKYMDNATNAAVRAGEVFGSITRNMESAIDNFVTTGKLSFGDLARSIIQDLIKIELKAQATAAFKAIAGTAGTFLSSIFGFAEGGSPPLNKPSIVGEKGPELFIPRQPGNIIPNNQLGMATAGIGMGAVQAPVTNNYITNNISALDAKSVAQLFAENRKTLLGTVEMARKEMPYYNR